MTLIEAIKDIYFSPMMTSFIYLFVISLSNGIKANYSIEKDFNKRNKNVLNKTIYFREFRSGSDRIWAFENTSAGTLHL